jgi:leucyl-tRNA synthetase
MMELINELYKAKEKATDKEEAAVLKYSIEQLLIMLSPFVPHIADELWEAFGMSGRLFEHPWPEFNPNWAQDSNVTMAVQVNGKLRATIEMPKDTPQTEAENAAFSDTNVKRFMEGVSVRKVIYVPNKIINIIVAAGK